MDQLLLFVLLGLATGGVTALLAVGLVGAYQSSGVVNFAHGAVAMFCAYCFTELRTTGHLVLPVIGLPHRIRVASDGLGLAPALVITLLYAAALGTVLYLLVFRSVRHAPPLAKVVASIGLMVTLQALAVLHFGSTSVRASAVLPTGTVSVLGVSISRDRLLLAAIALAIGIGLALLYRHSRFGVVTRAVAQNERSASLHGWEPTRVQTINWALATTTAALAGILAAPITSLNPTTMTLAVVPALAAALVAGFSSFTVAAVAGLAIGVGQSLSVKAAADWSWFPDQGMAETLPFLVIVLVMVLRGTRMPTRTEVVGGRLPRSPEVRRPALTAMSALVLASAGMLVTQGSWRAAMIQSVVTATVCLSFVVLTGFVGQASLVQAGFAGIGGFALANVANEVGLPFPVPLIVGGLAAIPIGLIVGIPALRIRGLHLAIITLGAGVALDALVFRNADVSGGFAGTAVPAPELLGVDLGVRGTNPDDYPRAAFGLAALAVLCVLGLLVANLRRSPTGFHALAVRSNERAAAAIGIDVTAVKLFAFGLAAFVAGVGGGLMGYQQGRLSPDSFSIFVALGLLCVAYMGGIASVAGAVTAGFLLAPGGLGFTALDRWFELGKYQSLVAGIGVMITAIANPDGIAATRLPRPFAKARAVPVAPPPSQSLETVRAAP